MTRAFSSDVYDLRHLPEVLAYIWNFEKVNRPLIESERLVHGPRVPLDGDDAISAFVRDLRRQLSG